MNYVLLSGDQSLKLRSHILELRKKFLSFEVAICVCCWFLSNEVSEFSGFSVPPPPQKRTTKFQFHLETVEEIFFLPIVL